MSWFFVDTRRVIRRNRIFPNVLRRVLCRITTIWVTSCLDNDIESIKSNVTKAMYQIIFIPICAHATLIIRSTTNTTTTTTTCAHAHVLFCAVAYMKH